MSEKTPYISPRLSPILQKYKTPSVEDTDLLRKLLSFEPDFEYFVNKQILDEKKNICIHPYNFKIIYADQFKDLDFTQELNESYSPEDYIDWYRKNSKIITQDTIVNDNIALEIQDQQDFWKTSFISCTKRFLIFPITLTHLILYDDVFETGQPFLYESFKKRLYEKNSLNPVKKDVTKHASFLIVDTVQKKGYFLDPSQRLLENIIDEDKIYAYVGISKLKIIKYKCEKMLKYTQPFLGIKEVEIVDVIAPQLIARDYNCLFWSLLMCDIIIKNLRDDKPFNPKIIIKSLLKKYNTKEKLERVIRRYISYVYETSKSIPNSFYKNMLKNTYIQDRLTKSK